MTTAPDARELRVTPAMVDAAMRALDGTPTTICATYLEDAIEAALAAAPSVEPAPPREPTPEMIMAGPDDLTADEKRRAWIAMYDAAVEPAQQPPCAHEFEVRTGQGQAWTECKKCRIQVIPAAQQPEAPQADELVARLRGKWAIPLCREAAARIESDARRIRTLEDWDRIAQRLLERIAIAADHINKPFGDLPKVIAASREREAQAYERAAKVVDDACSKRIGEHALGIDVQLQLTALAAAIRALATPDSAEQGEAK